ncbi:GNAT family N-acetyltransferase [Massilia sp. Mn16-1_5]|uniref:GNAT family N-acetyltransferase n=1 Tax=Massilia sp. Mn16-1_5 TaxID=2079199 RepID=UPI00109ED5D4|nr:GNAT family N-acetyltransferase [Massilia sp. Mn16-1_5]THC40087.1 GNAT family N-acetyltransferase [Massilia sp. Mn16-1_5]
MNTLYRGDAAVRRLAAHEWPLYRALRLRALADAPDAFGSTLAEEETRSDADWAWRLNLGAASNRDLPLVAQLAGEPVGLAWAKVDAADPARVNLFQVWIAPQARGHGLAGALLDAALAWARGTGARAMQLGVVCGNDAARRLYERAGFRDIGEPEPQRPGSSRMEQIMRLEL